jgi:hypothetical protein
MRQVREGWWAVQQRTTAGFAWLFPKFDAQDLHLWGGLAALAIGLEQIYHPLIWIAPGAAFTWLAWPKRPMFAVKPRKDS